MQTVESETEVAVLAERGNAARAVTKKDEGEKRCLVCESVRALRTSCTFLLETECGPALCTNADKISDFFEILSSHLYVTHSTRLRQTGALLLFLRKFLLGLAHFVQRSICRMLLSNEENLHDKGKQCYSSTFNQRSVFTYECCSSNGIRYLQSLGTHLIFMNEIFPLFTIL